MRDVLDSAVAALNANPKATMAELARAAGISRATLHRRFPSRERLLACVAEEAAAAAERAVRDARPDAGPPAQACARLVTALIPLGGRFAFLLREGAWLDELPAVAPGMAAVSGAISTVIRRGRRAAEFRVDLPAPFQERLVLAVIFAAWEAVQAGELGSRQAPEAAVAALLTGIETVRDAEVYWRAALPDDRPIPAAIPTDRVDVAVVGAGFAGLSIALDLLDARPGLRVALLDAHTVGHGASGRNAGALLPLAVLPWLLPGSAGAHDPRAMQGLLHARIGDRVRELQQAHPAGEIRPVRMLMIARNRALAAGLGWLADTVAAAGIAVEHWPGERVTATCGAPATAAIGLAAWTVQPAALVASLAARFVARGGVLLEYTPVAAVTPAHNGVVVELGSGRQLRADRAVICTGAYTGALAAPARPRARVVHTYMRASGPLPPAAADALGGSGLFLSAPGPGMPYWRVHSGRLLFGGMDVGGLPPGPPADSLPRAHRAVDRLLRRRLPVGAIHPPAYRWGGPIHVTRTEVPHLARCAASDRIAYAVGFSGSGVALTLSAGPLVRDLILGPAGADPEAVALRRAMHATRIPWRGVLDAVCPATAHLLRGLARHP